MTTDETDPGLVTGIMTEDAEGIEIAREIGIGIEVEKRAEMMTIDTSLEGTCFVCLFVLFCFVFLFFWYSGFLVLRFLASKVLKCSFFMFVCSLVQICGGFPSSDEI